MPVYQLTIIRLDPYSKLPTKEFEALIQAEIEDLKQEQNGLDLLHSIGYIYEQEGIQHLGGVFGFFSEFSEKAHTVKGI